MVDAVPRVLIASSNIQRYRYRGAQIPTPWETINAVPA